MAEIKIEVDGTTYAVNTDTDLVIDADDLSSDMVKIAGQFATYGALSARLYARKKEADQAYEEALAKAKEDYEQAKDELAALESKVDLAERDRLEQESKKSTEKLIENLVTCNTEVQAKRKTVNWLKNVNNHKMVKKAQQTAIQYEEQYRKVKTLADAFSLKASMLQSLGAMTRSEMALAGGVSTKEKSVHDNLLDVINTIEAQID